MVTTVSHQLLQDTGVKDIKDLALLAPGLLVTSTSSEASTTARIRGIGTVGDNPGLESSVGIVIDGVYRSRNGVGFGDLGDVERIEVLKGPQGTLFGKSATAGVINIITALPQFEYHADAEFTAGNYKGYGGAAEVTGPLISRQAGRQPVLRRPPARRLLPRQRRRWPEHRDARHRPQFLHRARAAAVEADRHADRAADRRLSRSATNIAASRSSPAPSQAPVPNLANGVVAALGGNDGNPSNPYARTAYANRPDRQKTRDGGVSLQLDGEIGPGTLTSITAYRNWKVKGGFDADFSTLDLLYLPDDNSNSSQFRTMSQELRYAGTSKSIDYLVGGFFSYENLHQNSSILTGSAFTPYLSLALSPLVEQRADPTFLQTGLLTFPFVSSNGARGVNYAAEQRVGRPVSPGRQHLSRCSPTTRVHLTSKLDFNIGLRYTIDQKSLNSYSSNIGGGARLRRGEYRFHHS